MAANPLIRVRMYRQGLGDCFLLSFFTGDQPVHMLIDCGTLGATTTGVKLADVVADIKAVTNNRIHVLIATHEHKDHVYGFTSERPAFDSLNVDRVWVAWTENPKDQVAIDLEKYQDDLINSVALTADALRVAGVGDQRDRLQELSSGMRELLGFFGDLPAHGALLGADFAETVHEAMTYATLKAGHNVSFFKPGKRMEPAWLPGVRVYVLGPPRNETALKNMGEHGSPELYGLTPRFGLDIAACARFRAARTPVKKYLNTLKPEERQSFERQLPFDPRHRIEYSDEANCRKAFPAYYSESEAWRRIDDDWLPAAADLALQLDSYTNNTSLVLAFELIDDGRVLLFPADAQLGNWLSWHELSWRIRDADGSLRKVQVADLLARTVLYKVGHHSSHNATVREQGLELMQSPDLVALIPVDRKVALNKNPPWHMPADALYKRLLEKTKGRVLRSDTGWPRANQRPSSVPKAQWDAAKQGADIVVTNLFVEYHLH